jgi:BirA family biotin operon repressor/biotin-[acetyl-CoA-carboxylase] ligase
MPMAIALSIRDTLKRFGIDARVKWPNDVLVRGHKIAGILVEHLPSKSGSHLIAGIGINVNMTEDDSLAIDREVTSILMQNGVETDPMPVMSGLLEELRGWLGKWESGGFQAIRHDWIEAAVGVGSRAVVRQPKQNIEGILEGFGEFGELVIKQDGGRRRILWSGDLLLDCAV